ncbi:organic cation transporter protein-like [Diadema antillarum]|uniref:organic cation transporter protein-like n=1 Tax=Diadema antillarum TaxID=105358 RepID=UPI003A8BAFFD
MRFDDILEVLGSFGPYQRRVYFVVCVFAASTAFHSMTQVFIAEPTDHWCTVSYWEDENCREWNLTDSACEQAKKDSSIPVTYEDGEAVYDECSMYNVTGYPFYPSYDASQNGTQDPIPCQDGWEHDTSQLKSSIVMDWDLVCDKKNYPDYAQSVFYGGYLVGSIFFGFLADKIGRRPSLFIAIFVQATFGVLVAFSPNYWVYLVFRFIQAAGNKAVLQVAFIIGVEFVGPKWRTVTGIAIQIFFAVAYMILAIIAYFLRYWKTLQLVVSAPLYLFFIFLPFIPESARWLISQGKTERAEKIIHRVAKINKAKLPDPVFTEEELKEQEAATKEPKPSVIDLFRTPVLRGRTINFVYNWMVNTMVYYGLTYGSSDLGVNDYLNFFVSGAVEIPGYVIAIFAIEIFGRRPSIATFLLVGGTACLVNIFLPLGGWNTAVAMIGKCAISGSYGIVYVYSAECFPTPVRSVGVGLCSMMARIGAIVSPLILILGDYYSPAPQIIFGVSTVVAGFLSFLLPETKGKKLPETIEEGEIFGTKEYDERTAGAPSDGQEEGDKTVTEIPLDDVEKQGFENNTFQSDVSNSV